MRLFGKKTSATAASPGAVGAEAEAAEEIRRATEALGVPMPPEGWQPPPAAADAPAEDVVTGAVPAPHEVDQQWGKAEAAEPQGLDPEVDDPLPEEAEAAEPVRRRVRKTRPGVASTPPVGTRASTRTSGSGRR